VSAALAAEAINGTQGEGVISTIKHHSLNVNETNRQWLDAIIDPVAHRESDLLAFEIAIERSQSGSVMSGYNKINRRPCFRLGYGAVAGVVGIWGWRNLRFVQSARTGVGAPGGSRHDDDG
jgi:glycosyl hydrolase family 3